MQCMTMYKSISIISVLFRVVKRARWSSYSVGHLNGSTVFSVLVALNITKETRTRQSFCIKIM